MRRSRTAKIVATLGPASRAPDMIERLFEAGVDVFRLNFSHGTHAEHAACLSAIRAAEQRYERPIGVLLDLQGPKLRIGEVENDAAELQAGSTLRLDMDPAPGNAGRLGLPHPEIFAALEKGGILMLDDGRIRLEVTACCAEHADTKVLVGGIVRSHKGVNVPGLMLPIDALTDKDRADLAFGLKLGVDWVAQSFVQSAADVKQLRACLDGQARLMVKIEKPTALNNLKEILQECDGVMLARGDLGVELPPQEVPAMQKLVARRCRQVGKPLIVATHMLDSMVQAPTPTRAEVSDVATAVYDGSDAVMLSAETASGDYPLESVQMMDRIIIQVEQDPYYRRFVDAQRPEPEQNTPDAIGNALQRVAQILSAAAIVTYTESGTTSMRAARERPSVPILCITPYAETARAMTLVWGLHPLVKAVATADSDVAEVFAAACATAREEGFAPPDQAVVIAAGLPFAQQGTTNTLHVAWA